MEPDEKPGGEPEGEVLSYEAQIEADARAAYDEVEKGAPTEPAGKESGDAVSDKPTTGQARDERGRFAKRDGEPLVGDDGKDPAAVAPSAQPAEAAAASAELSPAPGGAQAAPPPGWSIASKAAWDALPEHIRADVIKREGEVAQGLAALRDFKDVKPYAEMAQQSGTTLSAALQRYTTMEGTLRRDPVQGMMAVAHNIGLSQHQAAQLFAQLAEVLGARPTNGHQSNGGRQPSTNGSDQNDPLAEVIGPLIERAISPMAQQFNALQTQLTQRQQADQNAQAQSVAQAIQAFSADPKNRYFPELEETISRLFETGMVERTANAAQDLAKAYEMAAQLHPEVREVLISERLKAKTEDAKAKEKEAAAKARAASRSITGSATDGTEGLPPRRRQGSYDADLEADVRAAFDAVSGRA
jgi:hypothetical protein